MSTISPSVLLIVPSNNHVMLNGMPANWRKLPDKVTGGGGCGFRKDTNTYSSPLAYSLGVNKNKSVVILYWKLDFPLV